MMIGVLTIPLSRNQSIVDSNFRRREDQYTSKFSKWGNFPRHLTHQWCIIISVKTCKEIKATKMRSEIAPELEESEGNEGIKATDWEYFIFGDTKSPRNPSDRRDKSTESERFEGNTLAEREAASVIYGGIWWLLLEDGEDGEDYEGQAYVNGCWSQQTFRIHFSLQELAEHNTNPKTSRSRIWSEGERDATAAAVAAVIDGTWRLGTNASWQNITEVGGKFF